MRSSSRGFAPPIPAMLLVLLMTVAVPGIGEAWSAAAQRDGRAGVTLGGATADVDCGHFLSQADAQAVFDGDPDDPYRLDQGGAPGVPCEDPDIFETLPRAKVQNFRSRETAQALLRAASGDPYGLDPDGDRVACNGSGADGDTNARTGDRQRDRDRNRDREIEPESEPNPVRQRDRDRDREPVASLPTRPEPTGADIDCIDFASQEEAQAVLNGDPTDPSNLDPNGDSFACSELPSRRGVLQLPSTGSGTAWLAAHGPATGT